MIKKIDMVMSRSAASKRFGYKGTGYIVWYEMNVDLGRLSPAARFIAENIATTENRDDLSTIRVYGPTGRQVLEKAGRYEDIRNYEQVFGIDLDRPVSQTWRFDGLRVNESPEDYFERQVDKMKKNGWLRIQNGWKSEKDLPILDLTTGHLENPEEDTIDFIMREIAKNSQYMCIRIG